jgi:hypothetical protein
MAPERPYHDALVVSARAQPLATKHNAITNNTLTE